jgi:signal transduction histidine kinase
LPKIVEYLHENNITWQGITGPFNLPVQLKLPYNQNQVDFHFTGMHLDNMDKTRYRYILEGVDKSWSGITEKANAEYRNLFHGKYTFKVSSRGFNGKWSKPVEFEFEINPPWWLSIWAYIFYGLCVVALGFATNNFMRRRLLTIERERTRERELAQAKEIEKAYSELKSTQAQLIQSEKLASLGELTAGIAHEIQNPLNFVNNFSEVSSELVGEMNQELDKGDINEAKEIANDLKQNLEKITLHGKRASSIVKGMLEHSRNSTGVKELTDINALADEYLRLAYHGLRAKDVSFNSDFELIADENLPKIEVISQDMGRVLLNLINNAFWAVNERSKKGETGYEPKVTLSTQLLANSQLLIAIKDNGTGIPEDIKAKIFQPFFTTKPTGQGTGLGLSLAYDIVTKGHGGTLEVTSKEGEGSTFIITLPL